MMVPTATMAPMVRQDRPAILVQMGTMAQTATKVLRALKDPRATKAMPVLTELALQIKVSPSLSLSQPQ